MRTLRDLRNRIRSIESTKKITRAMKMVSTAKLYQGREKAEKTRDFFSEMMKMRDRIAGSFDGETVNYLSFGNNGDVENPRQVLMIVTGDRGLSGAYNGRVLDRAEDMISSLEKEGPVALALIGRKARDYFAGVDLEIIFESVHHDDFPSFSRTREIAGGLMTYLRSGELRSLYVIYTRFKTLLVQQLVAEQILPLHSTRDQSQSEGRRKGKEEPFSGGPLASDLEPDLVDSGDTTEAGALFNFEPESPRDFMEGFLPLYLEGTIYSILNQARMAEFAARMRAMDAATENAEEMLEDLKLEYNRARQEEITRELTEILGGVAALEKSR